MKKSLKLVFTQRLIREPMLFTAAGNYDIMPNIRRARVTDTGGEMLLDVEGGAETIEKTVESMRELGIEVEDVTVADE